MNRLIQRASRWIADVESITVLTGAGISAESGVPTFRGSDGLWRQHRAEELATPQAFSRNPRLVWEWYRYRQGIVKRTEPNAAHRALSRLGAHAKEFTLVTQNVDGLHQRAGSRTVVELHGNLFRARCRVDGATCELSGSEKEIIPTCAKGHPMRPDVVWFGEALPAEPIRKAHEASERCGLFLLIGTSAVVQPAASLPLLAKEGGARIIEVNVEDTPLTTIADIPIRGKAAETVPRMVEDALSHFGMAE